MVRTLLLLLILVVAAPAAAQDFPKLTGRVVDSANIIPDADEAELTRKLEALEQASSRQLVVATVPSLQGHDIADYGYQLGRHWGIGQEGANNGVILLVAPNERKVRIDVGYGLEPILTDALSHQIITEHMLPFFKDDNYPRGIDVGVDAIIAQLQAPPEQAERAAKEAGARRSDRASRNADGSLFPLIFWGFIFAFVVLRMIGRGRRGKRYRRRGGVFVWGSGSGDGDNWGDQSSGGDWGGFSGGGFSGGGGSFGGGGASGGW